MSQSCWAVINLSALQHNLYQIKCIAPHSRILAMIKGNAYGHGIVHAAKALQTADAFGLARFSEALKLREAGIRNRLVMMEGFTHYEQLQLIETHGLELVIHDLSQIQPLLDYPWQSPVRLWLKIDTGMGRLGMLPEAAQMAWTRLTGASRWLIPEVCLTHFAQAQWLEDPKTTAQIALFNEVCSDWTIAKSLANSAGILQWPTSHADWIRPGIVLYGVSPFESQMGYDFNLKPAMTLQAILIAVRQLRAGDTVGYDSTYQCPHAMRIGIAAIGYADGYPARIPSGTPVLVNGVRTTILGRVSMDMIAVDLNHLNADVGDTVTLWGEGLPIEVIAQHTHMSAYALLTGITERVLYRVV